MDKKIRYVYGVNPMTGEPCTYRLVLDDEVTLWWADGEVDEAAFDLLGSEEVGMICFTQEAFSEVLVTYIAMANKPLNLGLTTLEEEA